MAVIAVYSMKGGVGKTTLAANLAWCAAKLSARRTLVWDLDGQAATTWLLREDKRPKHEADALYDQSVRPSKLIRSTSIEGLDLMPADSSLRSLDRLFFSIGKNKRLARLIEAVARDYDRIVLDCPPGLNETSEQVLRAADIVLVPVIPSPLSRRAFGEVAAHVGKHHAKRVAVLPIHSMVDRRRKLHREAIELEPAWPAIPAASIVEAATAQRKSVGEIAPSSPAGQAFASLWRVVERTIADRLKPPQR